MENETKDYSYTVKTSSFEGPFSLLLHLVESKKFFINDVSLASVTEDYLNYINNLPEKDTSELSGFIVVAATLILIKSKSLLPDLELTEEENEDIDSLKRRLELFELFTKLGIEVSESFGKNMIFQAKERKNDVLVFLPDDQITKENMMTLAGDLLNKIPKKVFLPDVEVKKVVSLEEMIGNLTNRIQTTMKMKFKDFAGGAQNKQEKVFVIVSFLAMLELVRVGTLDAEQEENFADITIENRAEDNISNNNEFGI